MAGRFRLIVCCASLIASSFLPGIAYSAVTWRGNDAMNPGVFEAQLNWTIPTYDPLPSAGPELRPPGPNSIFNIGEGNHTVTLSAERSGLGGTAKLGTFSIGNGTFPEGTANQVTGPGNEISTFIILNSVTFTGQERASGGEVATSLRPIRIGRVDRNTKARGDGRTDFPWGIVQHKNGLFRYDPDLAVSSATELRIGMNDDVSGGSIFEISGTGSLNIIGKVRVGDRNSITSGTHSVFRARGSTMATNSIVMDDLKIASLGGMWDLDRPAEFESRTRFNRGKSVLEFVLDAGGVTPLTLTDALEIGDYEPIPAGHPEAGTSTYTPGFLRVKLSQPLNVNSTPGFVGQSPLHLVNADRIITTVPPGIVPTDPMHDEFLAGRFFDPDRSGLAVFQDADPDPDFSPHRFLPSGGQVISSYANAIYTWTIEYFEDSNGADNGIIGSYVRLVDGFLTGLPGDFDNDSSLSPADRALLAAAVAAPPASRHQLLGEAQHMFDLNADEIIDHLDLLAFDTYFLPPAVLAGDYNGDGFVDAADYTVWRNNLGGNPSALEAGSRDPGNMSATINGDDYTFWKNNYGMSNMGAGGLAGLSGSVVPEPSSVLLALLAVAGVFGIGRRGRVAA